MKCLLIYCLRFFMKSLMQLLSFYMQNEVDVFLFQGDKKPIMVTLVQLICQSIATKQRDHWVPYTCSFVPNTAKHEVVVNELVWFINEQSIFTGCPILVTLCLTQLSLGAPQHGLMVSELVTLTITQSVMCHA